MSAIRLVTWNIDAVTHSDTTRIEALLDHLKTLNPQPNILLLQEVSRAAYVSLLTHLWINTKWLISSPGPETWKHPFGTITLVSKSEFGDERVRESRLQCRAERVQVPSIYRRDLLVCDVWIGERRIRTVNVHLDSLAHETCHRPEQLRRAAELIKEVGCGIIAGDFNPVQEFDQRLVEENGLKDAWEVVRRGEEGYTWYQPETKFPGEQRFPPCRMDKVVYIGSLKPVEMRILELGYVHIESGSTMGPDGAERIDVERIAWSDHSGLFCELQIEDE